jgi:hypothetical protein
MHTAAMPARDWLPLLMVGGGIPFAHNDELAVIGFYDIMISS